MVILDVRIPKHIASSRFNVKGAVWVNPKEIDQKEFYLYYKRQGEAKHQL